MKKLEKQYDTNLQQYRDIHARTTLPLEICIQNRTVEATAQVQYLLEATSHIPTSTIELGPGIGGVTRALRNINPRMPIHVIDCEDSQEVRDAAKNNNASFDALDINQLTLEELSSLLERCIPDTIIAMRLPAQTILHLVNLLHQTQFKGVFLSSVIELPTECSAMQKLRKLNMRCITLIEDPYLMIEKSYIAVY